MKSLRRVVLGGALAAAAAAQDSRPAPEVFVRIGERTNHPWPLNAKDRLWVVTADPFVCDATIGYFQRTAATMRLLGHVLGVTVEGIDRSAWAKAQPADWTPLRTRLREVAEDEVHEPQAESLPAGFEIDLRDLSASTRALRALASDPSWQRAPIPRDVLDADTAALWRAFHELVRLLWGETALGWPGWLVRLAEAKPGELPVSHWPSGEGLLPRVPDLLSRWTTKADPLLDAPAWGASGVLNDLDRMTAQLRSALVRLTDAPTRELSERDALYRCVRGLLDEHEELARACAGQTELCALFASRDWRSARVESAAGLTVRARYSDHRSLASGSRFGSYKNRDPFRTLLLVSPQQQARLEELDAATRRAMAAWGACAALLPAPRAAALKKVRPYLHRDSGRIATLRGEQRHAGELMVAGDALSTFELASMKERFEAPLAAPDAPGGGGAADSWVRVPLAGRGLHAVEFRLWVDGDWRWGLGAMASCEVQKDGAWRPLRECWGNPR